MATAPLLGDFFIVPSLRAGCPPRADDANHSNTVGIHDREQVPVLRNAQQHKPLFPNGMTRISHDAA